MKIAYLGHAGFYVETQKSIVIMDPWVSPNGAFDSAWFQFPKNAHMLNFILENFENSSKKKYIYVSHEHKDHFDINFFTTLKNRNFSILTPNFKRSIVNETLLSLKYKCDGIVLLDYDQQWDLEDGWIRLFIMDNEIDCDSAILVKADGETFLNINDCKLHERLNKINAQYGPIDVFTGQFSGAIWHPVCYDLSLEEYQRISLQKKLNKFSIVTKSIQSLKPKVYLPSAGPPCFLDPTLIHLNFEKINIFPHAPEFIAYLNERIDLNTTHIPEIMPGDVYDVSPGAFSYLTPHRIAENNTKEYILEYAKQYKDYFAFREAEHKRVDPKIVFEKLRAELENKLAQLHGIHEKANAPLYWGISEYKNCWYKVDFAQKKISIVQDIDEPENFWSIHAPAWQVNKVLTKEMNWPDFVLTFRVRLKRVPDVYNTVIHGFISIDACELPRFSQLMRHYHENKNERITVEYNGKAYSILRWCPHLGGDLSKGWADDNGCWVCPRHQWHFNLLNNGKCLTSNDTIDATCLGNIEDCPEHPPSSKV